MAWTEQLAFPHTWKAEKLACRPLILPRRHFVYPGLVEEVEIGALELMVRPREGGAFLVTCALGFASDLVPTGLWSCPDPDWLCAVSGGYAYMVNTCDPAQWQQVDYRPVVAIMPVVESNVLVFASYHTLLAFDVNGIKWKTQRLSSEGLRLGEARNGEIEGWGWDMRTDREFRFAVDLATGKHTSETQI